MKKILVAGSINLDMVVNVDHTPVVGETILSDKMVMVPGGKGANQACAVGRLGGSVSMLGAVGDDMYAGILTESLIASNVDVSHIAMRREGNTGVAWITVNKNGDNCIVVISGANSTLSREDIDNNMHLFQESDIIVFQLEIPAATVVYGAKKAKELGKIVILDPAPAPKEFPAELYQYVDVIKPNETELKMLTGYGDTEEELNKAAQSLHNLGVKDVLVTLGEKGVYIHSSRNGMSRIPAVKVKAVDTTAAGDTFTAALALMLAEGKSIEEAAAFANCAAAIAVTRKGAQSSIPAIGEVEDFIREMRVI